MSDGNSVASLLTRNPYYNPHLLRMLMNSLPSDWTERQKEYQARLQYADIRCFLKEDV